MEGACSAMGLSGAKGERQGCVDVIGWIGRASGTWATEHVVRFQISMREAEGVHV